MMFSLIANLAELNKREQKAGKKTARNDCTFYLIEEPELFLHPNHQTYFRNKLEGNISIARIASYFNFPLPLFS